MNSNMAAQVLAARERRQEQRAAKSAELGERQRLELEQLEARQSQAREDLARRQADERRALERAQQRDVALLWQKQGRETSGARVRALGGTADPRAADQQERARSTAPVARRGVGLNGA
jgi:hypothetical protein